MVHYLFRVTNATVPTIANTKKTSETEIQIGESTQSHDQLITPVSFNAIKRIVSNPVKPMLLLLLLLLSFLANLIHTFLLSAK